VRWPMGSRATEQLVRQHSAPEKPPEPTDTGLVSSR
jgi:hypothetical protein